MTKMFTVFTDFGTIWCNIVLTLDEYSHRYVKVHTCILHELVMMVMVKLLVKFLSWIMGEGFSLIWNEIWSHFLSKITFFLLLVILASLTLIKFLILQGAPISFCLHIWVPRAHQVNFLNNLDKVCQKVNFTILNLMQISFLCINFYQRYRGKCPILLRKKTCTCGINCDSKL